VRHQPTTRRRVLRLLEAFDASKLGAWASNLLDELTKYDELTAECSKLHDRWREGGSKQLKAMLTAQEKSAQKSVTKSDGNYALRAKPDSRKDIVIEEYEDRGYPITVYQNADNRRCRRTYLFCNRR
jgi:hypothetical protein